MAAAMSLVMSLVDTIVSFGFAPDLSVWLGLVCRRRRRGSSDRDPDRPGRPVVGQLTGGRRADRGAVPSPEPAQPKQRGQTEI